jgi:hypothetical protein
MKSNLTQNSIAQAPTSHKHAPRAYTKLKKSYIIPVPTIPNFTLNIDVPIQFLFSEIRKVSAKMTNPPSSGSRLIQLVVS